MLMTARAKLIYRNSVGEELSLAPLSSFWCEKCEEQMTNQVHSKKQVDTHGKFFTGMSLDERVIVLTGTVLPKMNTQTAMSILQKAFNPTLAGKLYYENIALGIKRDIACRVAQMPKVYWSNNALKFDISLTCLDPFWKGQDFIEQIAQTLKQFKFPVAIPMSGMSFGTRVQTLESKFENAGNVESGFRATIRAAGGAVINPEIRNEATGERIRILYTLQKNDSLLIINSLQEKRVEINGINAFKHVDAEATTFFKLAVGTNRVGYSADENISNMVVYITYTPYYTHAEVL